jgi:hypothetical protein
MLSLCIIKWRKERKELTITIENNKEKKGRGFSLLNLNRGKRSGGDKWDGGRSEASVTVGDGSCSRSRWKLRRLIVFHVINFFFSALSRSYYIYIWNSNVAANVSRLIWFMWNLYLYLYRYQYINKYILVWRFFIATWRFFIGTFTFYFIQIFFWHRFKYLHKLKNNFYTKVCFQKKIGFSLITKHKCTTKKKFK